MINLGVLMDEFISAVKTFYNKYADFEGTASRSEYWWFYLYTWLLIPFCFIPYVYVQILFIIIALTTVIPYMAVAVRRMHDLNYSGWRILWGLIPLLGTMLVIVWYAREGNINNTVSSHRFEADYEKEKKVDQNNSKADVEYMRRRDAGSSYGIMWKILALFICGVIAVVITTGGMA